MSFIEKFKWFKKMPSEDIIFDVKNFNKWFNDPENNSTYANSGIFLRLDKLSEDHIDDYLKSYGEEVHKKYSDRKYYYLTYAFYTQIQYIWRKLIKEKK